MLFSRKNNTLFTRFLLISALFVQGILASHACVSNESNAINAYKMQDNSDTPACHHVGSTSANECLMHCTQSEQVNLDHHHLNTPIFTQSVLQIATPPLRQRIPLAIYVPMAASSGPPLTIRFCSFLI